MEQVLDKQIQNYLPLLRDEEKKSLISIIKSYLTLRAEPQDRISIERYNQELNEAEAEYENGDFISNEEMIKQIKKW